MKIRRIDIENFRGVRELSWRLPVSQSFFVLIGPGDSTKSTILTALERGLSDRWSIAFTDTDFHQGNIEDPILIRIALSGLPPELLSLNELGLHLAGIDDLGNWAHDPDEGYEPCVIVELRVDADLEPQWTAYRPEADDGEDPHVLRSAHRARFGVFRIDERVDAHLRWSRMSALGRLTGKKDDARRTLTVASRAARQAVAMAVPPDLQATANDVAAALRVIGSAEFVDLKPGLDVSLTNAQGNLALFDGPVPLTNFGLGTRRLAGVAAQQLAHDASNILLVDEIEYGLEPHRLVHLLRHLQRNDAFAQVFVTTHSPTALQHMQPRDLVMVQSTAGKTRVRSLGEPQSMKPLIKKNPEAFLSRRVVMCEGKTEYGLLLALLERWDHDSEEQGRLPSAALGVVCAEGNGGTGSVQWARHLLEVGYDVVLFIDSDEPEANTNAQDVLMAGGKVVQWTGSTCTERALCEQLDSNGLTAYIGAAILGADDPDAAVASFTDRLQHKGAPNTYPPLDVDLWIAAGMTLSKARDAIGLVAKSGTWFKNVDRGRLLAEFIATRNELRTGAVGQTIEELRKQIYSRPEPDAPTDQGDSEADGAGQGDPPEPVSAGQGRK